MKVGTSARKKLTYIYTTDDTASASKINPVGESPVQLWKIVIFRNNSRWITENKLAALKFEPCKINETLRFYYVLFRGKLTDGINNEKKLRKVRLARLNLIFRTHGGLQRLSNGRERSQSIMQESLIYVENARISLNSNATVRVAPSQVYVGLPKRSEAGLDWCEVWTRLL